MTTTVDPIQAFKDSGAVDIAIFNAPARDPAQPWLVYGAGCAIDVSKFEAATIQDWRNEGVLSSSSSVTPPTPPAPVISDVVATPLAETADITWTTDIAADSQVHYGADASYGTSSPRADTAPGVTSHSVALSGLTADTLYHYSVTSVADGQSSSSPDATFTTAAA
jgi:hypothetical protein